MKVRYPRFHHEGYFKLISYREESLIVPKVEVGQNESLDQALRRLKKKIEREGILKVLKARKHYEKPSEKRRRKQRTSKKRN